VGPFDRTVDVLVSRLRRKIEVDSRQPHLIRTVPGVGYKFTGTLEPCATSAETPLTVGVRTRSLAPLSFVVLPFKNLSGDPARDYFSDALTEDVTTEMSRLPGAFVIARNTAFTFKDKAVDVRELGRDLNVRYVIEGSVRRDGKQVRVTA